METSFADATTSSAGLGDDSLCGGPIANFENSVKYVEQELRTLALPSVTDQDSTELDKFSVVTVLQKLLLLHRNNLKVIDELRDNLTREKSDVLMQREAQARLKEDIKSGEKELAQLEDKERQMNQKLKSLTSKLRAEQDEVRRLKVSMQYKETQRIHESKKKEKELEKLKLKLAQLVSDRSHERRLGMSVLNTLHRSDGKRKLWTKPGSGDEDMYRVLISNYEDRQKELMLENSSLRESLAGMEKQLVCLLNEKQANLRDRSRETDVVENDSTNEVGASAITSGHFQMPYDIVRDGIEQNFLEKCQMVKKHIDDLKLRIERLEASPGDEDMDNESEIRKLEHKLSEYRSIIGQQEEMLLQKSMSDDEVRHSEMLRESFVWQEKSRLEEEKQLFIVQKQSFEKQRQRYMEAVHKLETERRNFEEEKVHFFKDQESLLNSTLDLDSFFTKLCSTPGQKSEVNLSKYISQHEVDTSEGSSVLQDSSTAHHEVDLKNDLSLCSDDGASVLNERPTESLATEQ